MPPHRTPAPLLLTIAVATAAAVATSAAAPKRPSQTHVGAPPAQIIFPVVGPARFSDDFGAPRARGGHQANDIVAERQAPLVAVEAGRVKLWTRSRSAGCMLYLYGRSGTTYLYIHLNNDVTRRNDNRGGCAAGVAYAPGLRDGQRVRAGAMLGFVGDSGDANGKHPHVHFELHPGGGVASSPYPWLRRARRVLYASAASAAGAPLRLTLIGSVRRVVAPPPAADTRVAVSLRRVVLSNGWRIAHDRGVTVRVPATALVEHTASAGTTAARLDEAQPREPLSLRIELARPSLRSQLAAPGVLAADSVLLRGTH